MKNLPLGAWFKSNSAARWYAGSAVALALALAITACSTVEFGEPVPLSDAQPDPVIRERIRAFEADSRPRPFDVSSFWGPAPDGRPVYLFTAGCCDQFNRLYDADGRFICAPSGGFTGAGDGKCPDWVQEQLSRRWRVPGQQPPASRNPG